MFPDLQGFLIIKFIYKQLFLFILISYFIGSMTGTTISCKKIIIYSPVIIKLSYFKSRKCHKNFLFFCVKKIIKKFFSFIDFSFKISKFMCHFKAYTCKIK